MFGKDEDKEQQEDRFGSIISEYVQRKSTDLEKVVKPSKDISLRKSKNSNNIIDDFSDNE